MPLGGKNSIFRKPLGAGKNSVGSKTFGKNSVFRKPLGVGSNSIGKKLKVKFKPININLGKEIENFSSNLSREFEQFKSGDTLHSLSDIDLKKVDFSKQLDSIKKKFEIDLNKAYNEAWKSVKAEGDKILKQAVKEKNKFLKKTELKGILKNVGKAIRKDYLKHYKKEFTKLKKNVDKELTKAKKSLDNELTKAKQNMDRELTKVKQDLDQELTVAKQNIDRELTNTSKNVSRETAESAAKLGKALQAAGEPKNLLKQAVVYAGSVYGGPVGAAFASCLCDKLLYNKDVTEEDFLKSMALGAAASYASGYVGNAKFSSEYFKNVSQSVAKDVVSKSGNAVLEGEPYTPESFFESVAQGAIHIDIDEGYVADITEKTLKAIADEGTSQFIHEKELDFDKLSDTIYTSLAEGITDQSVNKVIEDYIDGLIKEEHRRLDEQLAKTFKKQLVVLFYTCADNQVENAVGVEYILNEDKPNVKPPFTATPLGQELHPKVPSSGTVDTTPTANSEFGGYPGYTRSENTVFHGGIDDPSTDPLNNDLSKYHGTEVGYVSQASEAFNSAGVSLGMRVTIQFVDEKGVWESKTMHHKKLYIRKGDKINPGQVIAEGSGAGDQFNSPLAGEPHIHWQVKLNGQLVDPLTGKELKKK